MLITVIARLLRITSRRRTVVGLVATGALLCAPVLSAQAEKALDCPLRDAPFSVDMPLLDLLLSEQAMAAADAVVPGLSGHLPASRFSTQPPTMAAIMTLRQVAGMGMAKPAQVEAIEQALADVPVTDADRRARCARYDADSEPMAVPDAAVNILVFTKINGFDHGPSVTAATEAVRKIAQDKQWGVVVTDNGGAFTPDNLAQFDAVVWNNNSGDVLTLSQRAAFEAFIASGGAYVGLHGAGGDSIYLWDWYVDTLLGARFIGHPMNPQFQDAALHIEQHPGNIGAALAPGWTMNDEWYSFRDSPREAGANVVATLDESTYEQNGFGGQDLRMGADHPIVWTRQVGKGRAFYSAVGHRPEVYADERYMALLADGLGWAVSSSAQRCANVAKLSLPDITIASAQLQPANQPVPNSGMPSMGGDMPPIPDVSGLPAFCRVIASAQPEKGSDIQFEVWMPADNWDGRLNGGNAGGFAGYVNYMDLAAAMRAGQAGVATDTGHEGNGTSGDWARGRPERIRDYGWRGVHVSTVAAKEVLKAFYGRGPDKSYFIGCSNGGRQGLMEAARFPGDYDGIVAGAPAVRLTEVNLSMIRTAQAQLPAGAALTAAQAPYLQREVLRQCDRLDGQADSLVNDPRQCRFDTAALACDDAKEPGCFSPAQIDALALIMAGYHSASGERLAYGFPVTGAEAGRPLSSLGWEGWITGMEDRPATHTVFPSELLENFFPEPFTTVADFQFERDAATLKKALSDDLDASADLSAFVDRGGKLIIWHGWADAAISPYLAIDYYQQVLRESGAAAKDAVRLFMVPGLQHCFGGQGYGNFGQMGAPPAGASPQSNVGAAIQAWVEQGRAPAYLVGSDAMPFPGVDPAAAKTAKLCAYPARAVRKSGHDAADAASYDCVQ
jgi:type 1 glutamine amidotransferase